MPFLAKNLPNDETRTKIGLDILVNFPFFEKNWPEIPKWWPFF